MELWEELQIRAKGNPDKNVAGCLTVEDIAERTSSAVGSADDTGALFDETANAYGKLRIRTEELMIDFLRRNMKDALRPYSRMQVYRQAVLGQYADLFEVLPGLLLTQNPPISRKHPYPLN